MERQDHDGILPAHVIQVGLVKILTVSDQLANTDPLKRRPHIRGLSLLRLTHGEAALTVDLVEDVLHFHREQSQPTIPGMALRCVQWVDFIRSICCGSHVYEFGALECKS